METVDDFWEALREEFERDIAEFEPGLEKKARSNGHGPKRLNKAVARGAGRRKDERY